MGSLGPLSLEALILGAVQLQILVIWGPYELPVVVVLETQAENPKTAGQQCDEVFWSSRQHFFSELEKPGKRANNTGFLVVKMFLK